MSSMRTSPTPSSTATPPAALTSTLKSVPAPHHASSKHAGSEKTEKKVEFRFHCTYDLRQRMNLRLQELGLERGDVMVSFLEEWLKQTDEYTPSRKA